MNTGELAPMHNFSSHHLFAFTPWGFNEVRIISLNSYMHTTTFSKGVVNIRL